MQRPTLASIFFRASQMLALLRDLKAVYGCNKEWWELQNTLQRLHGWYVKDLACAPDETFPAFQVKHKGSAASQQAWKRERAVIGSVISLSLCNFGKW